MMKRNTFWKRSMSLLLALLMILSIFLTGCAAEDVDLALDIADALLESALEESETDEQPKQELAAPESSQAPPEETPAEKPAEIPVETPTEKPAEETEESLDENGRYTSPEDVARYIHTYGKLPCNYISKDDARALGWDSKAGNLWDVTDEMSIGGDRFGNYEGALPDAKDRSWKECDVNYEGGYRGSERLLYSNDGLIFYTNDHYETFTQLY